MRMLPPIVRASSGRRRLDLVGGLLGGRTGDPRTWPVAWVPLRAPGLGHPPTQGWTRVIEAFRFVVPLVYAEGYDLDIAVWGGVA